MRVCAVSSCSSNNVNNPQLAFFNFPKDTFLRDEWLEVLSLNHRDVSDQVKVCELHFKPKDFSAGRKQLKHHAIPSVRLGRGKSFADDNSSDDDDDEFMQCDSDSDPEILEVKKLSREMASPPPSAPATKTDSTGVKSEEDPDSTPESETGRRPSRRAALVAAEKISNVVRKLGLADEPHFPPKKEPKFEKFEKIEVRTPKLRDYHSIRVPVPDIDLLMECHEELLSAVQAEALLKAQLEYNMVMKRLRTLKAANARIICALSDEPEESSNNTSSPAEATTTVATNAPNTRSQSALAAAEKEKQLCAPVTSELGTPKGVYPVELKVASQQLPTGTQAVTPKVSDQQLAATKTSANSQALKTSTSLVTSSFQTLTSTTNQASAPQRYKLLLKSKSGVVVKQLFGQISTASGSTTLNQVVSGSIANSLKSQPSHVPLKTVAVSSPSEAGTQNQQRVEVKFVLDPKTRQMAMLSMADLTKFQPLFQKAGVSDDKASTQDMKNEILVPSSSCSKPNDVSSPVYKVFNGMHEGHVIGRLPDGLTILQSLPKPNPGMLCSKPRYMSLPKPNPVPTQLLAAIPQTESSDVKPASPALKTSSPILQRVSPALQQISPVPQHPSSTEKSASATSEIVSSQQGEKGEKSLESGAHQASENKVKDVVVGRLPDGLTILHSYPLQNLAGNPENDEDSEIQIVAEKKCTVANKQVSLVPVLKTGSLPITNANLLSVKPVPLNVKHLPRTLITKMSEKFREKLDQDDCLQDPVMWLSKMKLLPSHTSCQSCSRKTFLYKDSYFVDGYAWRCTNSECMKTVPVPRLICSARTEIPLHKLLLLIFHWAAESCLEKITKDVDLNTFLVRCVFQDIQEVCKRALTKVKKMGGQEKIVEVAVIQIGKFFVLGVMDRNTRKTRLKSVPVRLGYQPNVFRSQIEAWVSPLSVIVTENSELVDAQSKLFKYVLADRNITDPKSNSFHALNITVYLRLQLMSMFGKLWMNRMKIETLQLFLDELQWRDRFRITIGITFWNILKDMAEQNGTKVPGIPAFFAMATNKLLSTDTKQYLQVPQTTSEKKAENIQPVLQNSKLDTESSNREVDEKKKPPDMMSVVLDEYYYARKEPKTKPTQSERTWSFKCHFCKRIFTDNLKLMNHIIAHVEESRRCKLDLSDLTRCKHCFREFSTPYNMQCHMEAVHLKINPLACQICQLEFCFADSLISHMKSLHVAHEMPYCCYICKYRSSLHKDVLEHFNKVHHNTDYVLCPFCLKTYAVRYSNKSYSNHLYRHQFRSSVKKCTSCCLTFLSSCELQAHRYDDHTTGTDEKDVMPFKSSGETILIDVPQKKIGKPQMPKAEPKAGANKLVTQKGTPSSNSQKIITYSLAHKMASTSKLNSTSSSGAIVTISQVENSPVKRECIECKRDLESDHFKRHVSCGRCKYSTNCSAAFAEHMISAHSYWKARRVREQYLTPLYLAKEMFCECGFGSKIGNKLATHLVKCGKWTCYREKPPKKYDDLTLKRSRFVSDSESSSDSADDGDDELDVSTDDSFRLENENHAKNDSSVKFDSADKKTGATMQKCWAKRTFSRTMLKPPLQSPPAVEKEGSYSVESHSASFPPLIVLDDDEEMSINESFAKVTPFVDTNSECPLVPENVEMTEVPMEEVKEEEPDMLQALGLRQIKTSTAR